MIVTLVMIIGSLGFLIMGLINLFNNKIKEFFKASGVYKDIDSFMKYSALFNFIIGGAGIILGILNYMQYDNSNIFIVIYIVLIFILSIIQRIVLKKYKNF